MISKTNADLSLLATRLVEVFELEEFGAEAAKDIAEEEDLNSLVSAGLLCQQAGLFGGWSYSNAIPRSSNLASA